MSFNFGAKPPTTGAPAATTGGFSFGGAATGAAGSDGFSFGAPPNTTAAAPAALGGFYFSGACFGGTPAAPQAQVAPAASGGFSFGNPSAGVAQAPTTTGAGFFLGGGTSFGGTSALGAAPPSYNAAQTAAGGGFSLGGMSALGAPKTQAGPATGFSLGTPAAPQAQVTPAASGGFSFGTPSAGVTQAPTTTGAGFSLGEGTSFGGTSALGAAPPSYNAAQTAAGGGFSLGGMSALGAPKTQAGPATGFSLGATPSMAAAPGTITSGFSLGGAPSLGCATSIAGASQTAPGGFKLSGTAAPVSTAAVTTTEATGGFKLGGVTTGGGLGLEGGLGGAEQPYTMSHSKPTKQFSDDDLITCGICHIEMEHPRSLLCLHTYCLGCLREWSKRSKNEVICPLCREPTPLPPDGVDGLRRNFLVTKLKDRKAVSRQLLNKGVKIACTSCDVSDGNEAVARCLECDDFLCDSCFKSHKRFRLTKNHSVYTLIDLRSGKAHLTKTAMEENCKEHTGQVLWFYCKTCDVPICRDCTVVEHPPSSHEFIKIDEAITGQREEIQKLAETCKVVKKRVEEDFKQVHPMRENINSSCNAVCKAIDEKKDKLQKSLLTSLEKQVDDLKVTIASMKSVREKAASAYEEELQMLNLRLTTALDMASHVTRDGSDCDVASVYKHLTTTLHQLGQIKTPSNDLGNICFQEDTTLKTSVGCIGKIKETEIVHPAHGRSSIRMKKQWNATWKMVKKFGNTGEGKLHDAKGVAINQDGDVAVVDNGAVLFYF